MKADEAYQIGERGHPVRAYLDPEAIVDVALRAERTPVYPGYGFLSENPHLAEACANAGITFIGPTFDVLELTGNKARAVEAARAAGVPTLKRAARRRPRRAGRVLEGPVLPALRQGGRRRWRPRHAQGGRGVGPPGRHRHLHARGRGRLRRPDGVHRGGRGRPAPHRGADPRRRPGPRDPPLRARLLGAASPPEGRRDRARSQPRPGDPRAHVRRRGALRRADRLPQRRHRRVPARPRGPLRLHRDEPAHPGRAHRDRGGHRRRPGAVADADRVRRDPRGPRPEPGHRPSAGRGAAVPDHHRGPVQRLPAGHRQDHDVPLPRRRRRSPGRRYDVHRRRDLRPLRLDARQAHLPRTHLRDCRAEGTARGDRVPDPWRRHQHPVPDRAARRARLPRGPGDDQLHRGAPRPAQGAPERRPRHPAAHLAGRGHRQQAVRRGAGQRRPRQQAARTSTSTFPRRTDRARRCSRSVPRASPPTCGNSDGSASPTPPSATPTSPCSPPGCAPATCSPSPDTCRG